MGNITIYISYDITDNETRGLVLDAIKEYEGERINKSLYKIEAVKMDLRELRDRIKKIIRDYPFKDDDEDEDKNDSINVIYDDDIEETITNIPIQKYKPWP